MALLSAWLLWPVPTGSMPMSADHTVHLTRIWMWCDQLLHGQLRGWDPTWFFGTPVGELYPVLGDAIVIAIRGASLGVLDWPAAYALGFFIVFAAQGWAVLRAGRAAGLGALPGLVAATLLLVDAGAYREGGWLYTVVYGVWPQALSTALTWLAFGELLTACADHPTLTRSSVRALSCDSATATADTTRRRHMATAALALGGSLLAHPMAMLSTAIGGPLLIITLGFVSVDRMRRTVATSVISGALGLAIAAWWVVPMLSHRGWMASYGWMWRSLAAMGKQAADGHFAQGMPTAVGVCIALGVVLVAVAGSRPARFFVAFGLVLWAMASKDALWELRLDHLSSGFSHLQYQRFIIAAKPGLYLAAGFAIAMLTAAARTLLDKERTTTARRVGAVALGAVALSGVAWMVQGVRQPMDKAKVGTVQVERLPGAPQRDADLQALCDWVRLQAKDDADAPWRMSFRASRNVHWFMDAPVTCQVGVYKQGFTPGDNFVHKPESGKTRVLDRLGVRYLVLDSKRRRAGQVVKEFGQLKVIERPDWRQQQVAWLDGPGTVTLSQANPRDGAISGTIRDSGGDTRLVFAVGGFPRWELLMDGQPVEWFEVPVTANAPVATQDDRRQGRLRGGKAAGDDGSEPTLIAADVGDGTFELRYRSTTARDVLATVVSVLGLGFAVGLLVPGVRSRRVHRWVEQATTLVRRASHPALAVLLVVVGGIWATSRWREGSAQESVRAVGWVADGRAKVKGRAHMRPFKTDMLIQPAVVVSGKKDSTAHIIFADAPVGDVVRGWVAIDDDASKMRREGQHQFTVQVAEDGEWKTLRQWKIPHRGGTTQFALPIVDAAEQPNADVRVTVHSTGDRPPLLGFDLQLNPESDDE